MSTATSPLPRTGSRADAAGRLVWPLLATAAICCAAYRLSPNFRPAPVRGKDPYAGDFLQEWIGGHIVRAGDYQRFYDVPYARALEHDSALVGFSWDRRRYLPIVYPPFYYLLVSPLSRLPLEVAAWLWAALMLGCLAAAALLLGRAVLAGRGALALRPARVGDDAARRAIPWLLPAAVLFAPTLENLTTGQKGTVCLLILTGTFLLLERKRPFCAGLVFGLLAFKPQLTLVIAGAMLLKRQWRLAVGGAVTGTILVGLSALLGWDVCLQYLRFSAGAAGYIRTGGYALDKSHCLYGCLTLLAGGRPTWPVQLATLLVAAMTMAVLGRLLAGPLDCSRPRFAVQYSGLVIATVLLSPHLFTYDLTILLLPMFLLAILLVKGSVPGRAARLWPWLLVLVYVAGGISPPVASRTGVQITTPILLVLLFCLARSASATPRRAGDVTPLIHERERSPVS